MRQVVKVLTVETGEELACKCTSSGVALASFGCDGDLSKIYIVTDGITAASVGEYPELDPAEMARVCADAINYAVAARKKDA